MNDIFDKILIKINVKSVSSIISLVLIISGITMCIDGLNQYGEIDIKSAIISGKISTGSLGLMVIFLGVIIILTVILKSGIVPEGKGEKIELQIDDKKIICENLSYRKVQEIHNILKSSDKKLLKSDDTMTDNPNK